MASPQVLVVEDDPAILDLIAELVRDEGYTVETAHNGAEALAILNHSRRDPCCILLDLMMPVMSGWELMSVLRQDDRLVTIPIVVVSAEASASDVRAARILKKPIAIEQLLDAVRDFCGPGQECRPS
jgi:CheY-like chemotaxis protein